MDSVTNTGVSTKVSQKLAVQKPAQDIKVTSATYYITGTSNPNESLYVNGQQVTNRGKYGSFGVFVSLELGDNVFNFQNGDATDSVTLTRVASAAYLDVSTTSYLTNPFPTYDNAFPAGKTIKIKCVAPSGASVSANVGGQTVYLSQDVSTAKKGVACQLLRQLHCSKFQCEPDSEPGQGDLYHELQRQDLHLYLRGEPVLHWVGCHFGGQSQPERHRHLCQGGYKQ